MQTHSNSITRTIGNWLRSFSEHPATVDETYFEHLLFAGKFSIKLILAALAALIHALIPAFFQTTASRLVCEMHECMESRHSPE